MLTMVKRWSVNAQQKLNNDLQKSTMSKEDCTTAKHFTDQKADINFLNFKIVSTHLKEIVPDHLRGNISPRNFRIKSPYGRT